MLENLLLDHIPDRFLEDERYRRNHIAVIHPLPRVRILGVHIPEMKKIAYRLVKEDGALELLSRFSITQQADPRSGLSYEEKQIWGMLVNRIKVPMEERIGYLRGFIPAIDNWAVCDTFCADAKWMKKNPGEIWPVLREYSVSGKEFEVRFAIVAAMAHFLDREHIDEIYHWIASLSGRRIVSEYQGMKSSPYYVNMAAAWLMATALYKLPEITRAFANSGTCPPEIVRLYVRKAKESFRTKNESPF